MFKLLIDCNIFKQSNKRVKVLLWCLFIIILLWNFREKHDQFLTRPIHHWQSFYCPISLRSNFYKQSNTSYLRFLLTSLHHPNFKLLNHDPYLSLYPECELVNLEINTEFANPWQTNSFKHIFILDRLYLTRFPVVRMLR